MASAIPPGISVDFPLDAFSAESLFGFPLCTFHSYAAKCVINEAVKTFIFLQGSVIYPDYGEFAFALLLTSSKNYP